VSYLLTYLYHARRQQLLFSVGWRDACRVPTSTLSHLCCFPVIILNILCWLLWAASIDGRLPLLAARQFSDCCVTGYRCIYLVNKISLPPSQVLIAMCYYCLASQWLSSSRHVYARLAYVVCCLRVFSGNVWMHLHCDVISGVVVRKLPVFTL